MKPQILVVYYHDEHKLAFVSAINESRVKEEARVEKQYSRARSLMKGIEEGTVAEHGGGFFYAVINTKYTGWRVEIDTEVIDSTPLFLARRQHLIDKVVEEGWTNVGSDIARLKGEYGKGTTPTNWNRKFNVSKLTRSDIFERITRLEFGSEDKINNKMRNEVYYSIVMPDSYGPRARNFGNYDVDSLSNIFLYIHHLRERAVTE